jgi:amidohydrolase
MRNQILTAARAIHPEQVALRRDLHMHPEVHFATNRTAGIVAERLRSLGLEVRTGVGKTGVVGILRGRRPGRVVALRADMDALAMQDRKSVPYKSQNEGACHACGHDGHTTMVLGAAQLLSGMRDQFDGEVRFLFQPAEENPSGGALAMIADGALEGVDEAFGLHLWPDLPVGSVAAHAGPTMAASDYGYVTITGKGGHAAMPHLCIDSIAVAAQAIVSLQQVVSRQTDPLDSAVLTIGTIKGGERPNVVAHDVEFTMTLRTLSPASRERIPGQVEAVLDGVTRAYGATYAIRWMRQAIPTVNDPASAETVRAAAREVLGADRLVELAPSMAGEDFGYMIAKVPGCYFKVGAANPEKGLIYGLHHPLFDFDEEALTVGTSVAVGAVLKALDRER